MHGNPTAVFTKPREVIVADEDRPSPGERQLLVRTTRSLISTGTELTIFSGDFPHDSAWPAYGSCPFHADYSNVGRVQAVVPGVRGGWAGNRAHQDRDGADSYYYYDQANQLLRIESNGALTYFQYDDNGNTIAEQTADGTTYYHYTPENRLSKVLSDIGGGTPNYFYYDGDQRRIISEDSQGRTYFLYDGEKIAVEKNAAGTTQAAYVNQGPSIYEPLVYMDRGGTKSYHLFDHLGTTLALASDAQALTDTYRRNAWGVELASTGATTNPFGYVGELGYHEEAGLSMFRAVHRMSKPPFGRWLARDPQSISPFIPYREDKLTEHLYAYCANNPLTNLDLTGKGVIRRAKRWLKRWWRKHGPRAWFGAKTGGGQIHPIGMAPGIAKAGLGCHLGGRKRDCKNWENDMQIIHSQYVNKRDVLNDPEYQRLKRKYDRECNKTQKALGTYTK